MGKLLHAARIKAGTSPVLLLMGVIMIMSGSAKCPPSLMTTRLLNEGRVVLLYRQLEGRRNVLSTRCCPWEPAMKAL